MSFVSNKTGIRVQIDFSTPSTGELRLTNPLHTREVKNVPSPVAKQMIRDFATYRDDPSESNRYMLYSYRPAKSGTQGSKVRVPLDFSEVRAIRMQ